MARYTPCNCPSGQLPRLEAMKHTTPLHRMRSLASHPSISYPPCLDPSSCPRYLPNKKHVPNYPLCRARELMVTMIRCRLRCPKGIFIEHTQLSELLRQRVLSSEQLMCCLQFFCCHAACVSGPCSCRECPCDPWRRGDLGRLHWCSNSGRAADSAVLTCSDVCS